MARTALVTGAGQNIGRAVACRLAADGLNVVVNGLAKKEAAEETAAQVRAAGAEAIVAMGDIGSEAGCRSIAEAGLAAFGRIDVLVNNAAIRPASPFLEMPEGEWERVMEVDLGAAIRLSRALLPGMIEGGWGRIINFAGMNAIHGYNGRSHVSVAKHGAWGLTKALAKEFGDRGVTANIISPGPTASDHDDPAMTAHIQAQVSKIPVGRLGACEEVAAAASWLASDAGAFVNGQLIQVNGGAQT
jgi:3-oxoacyl-[acyl-carrier protein] reductase